MPRLWRIRGREEKGCRRITFVELILVLLFVVMLAGLGTIAYTQYRDNVNRARAITDIRTIEHDIYIYEGHPGKLPDSLDQMGEDLLFDAWGNQYQYHNTKTGNGNGQQRFDKLANPLNVDFDLYSVGKNGMSAPGLDKPESQDDVVRADNGEFVGMASEF